MEITDLIELAKQRANLKSDYALSKATGIPQNIISSWKRGTRHPSNEEAIKLAALANLDEMRVIAEIELKTAKTEQKKDFWRHYIESKSLTGCLAITALGAALIFTPEGASATEKDILQLQDYGTCNYVHESRVIYIMRMKYRRSSLIVKAIMQKWYELITTYNYRNAESTI